MDGHQDAEYRRGQIVETSLGTGIICDYCEAAEWAHQGIATNHITGEQIDDQFDIYTRWHDNGKYEHIHFCDDPNCTSEYHEISSNENSNPVNVNIENTNTNNKGNTNIWEDAENKKQDELNEIFGIEPEEDTKTETQKPNYDIGGYTPKDPEPEYVEIPIEEGTPEAILQAASKFDEVTSDSEYVCSVLNEAGYLSYEGVNQFKDYSITELCKQFEKFGWERITDTANLQVGDIIIINNGEGECMRIYAGNNKWYVAGAEEVQQGDINWAENSTWYAYRPSIDETGPTMNV